MIICPSFWNRGSEFRRSGGRFGLRLAGPPEGGTPNGPEAVHGSTNTGIPTHTSFDKIFRVPVRQPETAVRFCPPHLLGNGRAVNAVAGLVQTNPRHAHRIVRAGRDDQFLIQSFCLPAIRETSSGSKCVIRIRRNDDHLQFADRPFLDVRRDAARKMREQICLRVKRLQKLSRQMNDGECRLVRPAQDNPRREFSKPCPAARLVQFTPGLSRRINSGCEWLFSATSSSSVS